jgi:hypothetical protein
MFSESSALRGNPGITIFRPMKEKFQREKDLLRKITRDYEDGDFI